LYRLCTSLTEVEALFNMLTYGIIIYNPGGDRSG
jgi:hypothetical protein